MERRSARESQSGSREGTAVLVARPFGKLMGQIPRVPRGAEPGSRSAAVRSRIAPRWGAFLGFQRGSWDGGTFYP